MDKPVLIEICVDSIESAMVAQRGGAHRIELCSALIAGGLTPSKGLIEQAVAHLKIPVFVLIRPREGDFLYSRHEFNVIKSDIYSAKVAGASGIVIGLLNSDGTVDTCRMKEVVEMCSPLPVTFHRAFDMTNDRIIALDQIIELGCKRILTSGGSPNASLGRYMISAFVGHAADRIVIMAGAGINESNFMYIAQATGCKEFHLSARSNYQGRMKYQNERLTDVFPSSYPVTDINKVQNIVTLAASL